MNYLAHLFLSGQDENIIYGNMLEDFMHGRIDHPRNAHLSEGVKLGIKLHRHIDTFTDHHLVVREAKSVFNEKLGRYSSIAIDVVFDHFLIKNWAIYTAEDFVEFRYRIYGSLEKYTALMPERLWTVFNSMKTHDWLRAYEYDEGLANAFRGLNKKIKNGPDLLQTIPIMHENYAFLNSHFLMFFNEMKQQCDEFLKEQKDLGKIS